MNVSIEKTGEKRYLLFNGKVKSLLKVLRINPETVIVIRNNKLIFEEDFLNNKDSIRIMSVISGG